MATDAQRALRNYDPKPGRYSDGHNLYLKVARGGSRSWVFMSRLCGELGLGSATGAGKAGKLSRQQARRKANAIHVMLAEGKDPKTHLKRRGNPVRTFGTVALACIDSLKAGWKNPHKDATSWQNSLDQHAAMLAKRAVATITTEDVVAVLEPIWTTKPAIAEAVRSRIERVLDYARTKNHRSGDNPARWRGHLALILSKQPKLARGNHAAMSYRAVGDFMARLATIDTVPSKALQLAVLTAARRNEIAGALWSEIDLDNALWTIPAARMKGGEEHYVPLSRPALALLRAVPRVAGNDHVFAGRGDGRSITQQAMRLTLDAAYEGDATAHGFRSSFRDWAGNETTFPRDLAEECLAHAIGNAVERAYRRGAAIEKRRKLLAAWAAYVSPAASLRRVA